MANLWNFIQFQVGWFGLVLSAAAGKPYVGIALMLALAMVHLRWFATPSEALTLLAVTSLGWVWESLFHLSGLIAFPGYSGSALTAPFWMAMLWLNFATVLNHSLKWLHNRVFLSALCGAVGGPLAFWAGAEMGAAVLPKGGISLLALSLAWGLLLPLMVFVAGYIRLGRFQFSAQPEVSNVGHC